LIYLNEVRVESGQEELAQTQKYSPLQDTCSQTQGYEVQPVRQTYSTHGQPYRHYLLLRPVQVCTEESAAHIQIATPF
jgi:hypothetical protein